MMSLTTSNMPCSVAVYQTTLCIDKKCLMHVPFCAEYKNYPCRCAVEITNGHAAAQKSCSMQKS
jgi:hypothetical protein